MPSALWLVRPALHAMFESVLTDAKVYDGPRPRSETPKRFVIVAAGSGTGDDTGAAQRSVQSPSPMGGGWRHEDGEIDCTAVAWSGDTDLAASRDAARDMVDRCEAAINNDPTLSGILTPSNNFAEVISLDLREAQTDKGAFVEAVFTVSYGTLLT